MNRDERLFRRVLIALAIVEALAIAVFVLARIDKTDRSYRLAFFGAVALEGLCLMTFLFAADFANRKHVLLLLGTVMTFSIVALGLVALGANINRGTLRVLQAIDASATRDLPRGTAPRSAGGS